MKRLGSRTALVLAFTLGFWLLVLPSANAYLDPGSGSVMIQALAVIVLPIAAFFAIFWKKIKALFSRKSKAEIEN